MFGFSRKREPVDTSLRERVEAGAAVLDTKVPGWVDMVNLDNLDLSSNYRCVLGQTSGSFTSGMIRVFGFMNARHETAREHGFDALRDDRSWSSIDREYELLTAAWREEIIERREKVSA